MLVSRPTLTSIRCRLDEGCGLWRGPEFLQLRAFSFMGQAMIKYYRKDIPEMPVYVHGQPLKFEILETGDSALIEELDKCVAFGRGGVIAMTAEEYAEESKKKPPVTNSESVYKQRQRRLELSSQLLSQSLAVDGAGVSVSSAFAKPQDIGRSHTPHERFGMPSGVGPGPSRPMPDPIDLDRKSTRLNSSHLGISRMPSSA